MTYKPTIGIEVHAELKTRSKMFCGCKNDPHASEANENICPVCLAHPGTLPVVNKEAVKKLLMVGTAVSGDIASYTEFDRKNYFYPDIPKAYQLSQYQFPFVRGGELDGVSLTRIHLEEDTARSQHNHTDTSSVDFNRAGVPLMELVTEPVVHSAEEAAHFAKELQLLLKTLGVSDANMEKGEMRVEANISVSKNDELGTKVEVKNLNSFKAMESAIRYEMDRQSKLLESGDKIVQETRGWDENKGKTFSQRTKESADDYRYFPDPDIPKMNVSRVEEFDNSRLQEILPKLASEKRVEYKDLGLPDEAIEVIIQSSELDIFFSRIVSCENFLPEMGKLTANYLTSDVLAYVTENGSFDLAKSNAHAFVGLITLLHQDEISSRVAKDLLPEVLSEGIDAKSTAEERGLLQKSSDEELTALADEIIAEQEQVVSEFKSGKEASLQFLVGQGMKKTQGSANPGKLAEVIKSRIS